MASLPQVLAHMLLVFQLLMVLELFYTKLLVCFLNYITPTLYGIPKCHFKRQKNCWWTRHHRENVIKFCNCLSDDLLVILQSFEIKVEVLRLQMLHLMHQFRLSSVYLKARIVTVILKIFPYLSNAVTQTKETKQQQTKFFFFSKNRQGSICQIFKKFNHIADRCSFIYGYSKYCNDSKYSLTAHDAYNGEVYYEDGFPDTGSRYDVAPCNRWK